MKRLLITLALAVAASAAFARNYHHSIGVNLGSLNGVSYKGFVGSTKHFVIQADINYQLCYHPESDGMNEVAIASNDAQHIERYSFVENPFLSQSVMLSPSFMYEGKIGTWDAGTLNWYAGAGVGLGFTWGGAFDNYSKLVNIFCEEKSGSFSPWIKPEIHAIGGIEFCFSGAPLVLGIDLKPGFSEAFYTRLHLFQERYSYNISMFDWGANLTLRYCFGK